MPAFPAIDRDLLYERLVPPATDAPVRLVIDTDCANEIDDQYALAWALFTPERMTLEATVAEPFSFRHHLPELKAAEAAMLNGSRHQEHLVGGFQGWIERLHAQGRTIDDLDGDLVDPARGMELSYHEIRTIYEKCGFDPEGVTFRGADRYMTTPDDVVWSDGAEAIVDLAKSGKGAPLYIAAMGCVTNIAAALRCAPEIVRDIVVIWTSAYPSHAPHSVRPSLNLIQDVHAARILFDCGVPLIYLPGYHVGAQLKISRPEMEAFVKGRGAIGDYLWHLYTHNPLHKMFALDDTGRRSWVIWDMIDIAWLIDPALVPTFQTSSPIINEALYWDKDDTRHPILEAHDVQRDEIFLHFYDKLAANASGLM
ncbi:nucleoside hydrolase [Oricola sp.]|uniref:nucleoside hydrolase n=1 Tax=Oricola sp. TaxID=1979950 RepID=UPI003BA8CD6D